jgi:hypothetical protein
MAFTEEEEQILKNIAAGFLNAQRGGGSSGRNDAPRARGGNGAGGPGKMRFGRAAGTAFADADDRDLEWYAEALEASIANPDKAQYRDNNKKDLKEVRAVQARRKGAPPPSQTGELPHTGGGAAPAADDNWAGPAADDGIPFAVAFDLPGRHERLVRWERW